MLKHKQSDSTQTCSGCIRNHTLIKKYESLINLYKKKQIRLSIDGPSRIKTTSHTIEMPNIQMHCIKLVDLLTQITRPRLKDGFLKLRPKKDQKLALLSIANKITKLIKKAAFMNIQSVQLLSHQGNEQEKIDYDSSKTVSVRQKQEKTKESLGLEVISDLIMQINNRPEEIRKACVENLRMVRQLATSDKFQGLKMLKRSNFKLRIQNNKLSQENFILRQCIEDLNKRQLKENEKKRESLEMLAEEISEKNEEIVSLKQTVKKYELVYEAEENILEEDVVTMRSDIEHLQRIREKLNNDLDKLKLQLQKTVKSLKAVQSKNEKLSEENDEIKKKGFEVQLRLAKAKKAEIQLASMTEKLQRKMKRLSLYEKQLQELNKEDCPKQLLTATISQQLKSEIVLMFLTNISDADYELQSSHLFDEEQKSFLLKHKEEWNRLLEHEKMLNKIESTPHSHHIDFSGIEGKGGHMDSIFQALDSPRDRPSDARNAQGPTMRMLELEIQRNKQIQKISELKQKFLHVRIIILNLLKSLELQAGMKTETLDIIRLIFDLFQFSEQERESVFVKKRRLFSFL